MNFESAKSSYLDQLRIERGLSSNSIASYSRDLGKLERFLLQSKRDYAKLSTDDITEFSVFLKGEGLSLSSVNRSISGIKGFYKYLALESGLTDPTTDISSAKLPRKLPNALTIDEVTRLI